MPPLGRWGMLMKTRVSLIVANQDRNADMMSDRFFSVYVDDNDEIPIKYISSKDEEETLKELWEEHFDVAYEWAYIELADFWKPEPDTCEAIYVCMTPAIRGMNKGGSFCGQNSGVRFNERHERIIAFKLRPGYVWSRRK